MNGSPINAPSSSVKIKSRFANLKETEQRPSWLPKPNISHFRPKSESFCQRKKRVLLQRAKKSPPGCLGLCCCSAWSELRASNLFLDILCSASPLVPRCVRLSLLYFGLLLELALSALFFNLDSFEAIEF